MKYISDNDSNYYLSLSSIISSILIVITLWITNRQNRISNNNFLDSQKESKEQFNQQQKFYQKQQFESTFFNMAKQLEDIVSKLSLEIEFKSYESKGSLMERARNTIVKTERINISGRDVFKYFFNSAPVSIIDNKSFKKIYELENDKVAIFLLSHIRVHFGLKGTNETISDYINAKGVKNIINDLGIVGYENIDNIHILDHYFRYLYRIMKLIDESKFLDINPNCIDERYKYSSILRATLSPYELIFLFYNGLIYKDFKLFIEKYSLLNNLRPQLTANFDNQMEVKKEGEIDIYSLKDDKIDDKIKYDYYRFQTDAKGDPYKYYWSAFEKDSSLFITKKY